MFPIALKNTTQRKVDFKEKSSTPGQLSNSLPELYFIK
jgi:hypothetical protein